MSAPLRDDGTLLQNTTSSPSEEADVLVVATLGGVDSGKSSLVGVLTSNIADDGRGSARQHVLRHEQERVHGRTSDPSLTYLGFDKAGQFIPISWNHAQHPKSTDVSSSSSSSTSSSICVGPIARVVNLLDCCGHLKYLGTSIMRFVATRPHFALVMVDCTSGQLNPMTVHHLHLCCAMQCRIVLVLTKIDVAPKDVSHATLQSLKAAIGRLPVACLPHKLWTVRAMEDVDKLMENNLQLMKHYTPIFAVSAVTLKDVDVLQRFLQKYPVTRASPTMRALKHCTNIKKLSVYYLDRQYDVRGIGRNVFSGFVVQGAIYAQTEMWFGPLSDGRQQVNNKSTDTTNTSVTEQSASSITTLPALALVTARFVRVRVKSLQVNREPVLVANTAQCTAAALGVLKRSDANIAWMRRFQPGRVLVSDISQFSEETFGVCMRFEVELLVTHHATTIQTGFQCVCHTHCVRQAIRLLSIDHISTVSGQEITDTSILRSGYHARVTVEWICYPELLICGSRIVLREGQIRAIGRVTRLHLSDVRIET